MRAGIITGELRSGEIPPGVSVALRPREKWISVLVVLGPTTEGPAFVLEWVDFFFVVQQGKNGVC